jgi:spermidine synthase
MAEVRLGEDDGRPVLLVDGTVQSVLADDPSGYWSRMMPDVRPGRALLLGLGAGTIARLLHERFGDVPVVGVDDDLAVVDFARELLRDLPSLQIVHGDAFDYVEDGADRGERFDYAGIDLYRGDHLVHGVVGRPFLRSLRTLLAPRGQAVFNLFQERRVDDRVRRIERVFRVIDRQVVGKNLILWCRAAGVGRDSLRRASGAC